MFVALFQTLNDANRHTRLVNRMNICSVVGKRRDRLLRLKTKCNNVPCPQMGHGETRKA